MASLTHGLLTEDEAVLLAALAPAAGDRVLAIFARGNGDAALCLLAGGPEEVIAHDLFDSVSLAAHLEFKRWLFANLDATELRGFVGVDDGLGAARREEIIAWAMREVGPACRAFWEPRRAVLRGGMAQCDDTAKWERMLARFLRVYRRMPPGLRRVALRAARLIAPLYFPREEQAHSLGYRQLLERPEELAERFMRRLDAAGGLRLIPYAEFRYLSADGHAAVRTHLSRLRVAESIESRGACNKLYLSNAIDYLSEDSFRQLLRSATRGNGNWRALVNTSYSSPGAHPCLKSAEEQGVLRIDRDLTGRLRAMDRVGVYPGLAVIHAP